MIRCEKVRESFLDIVDDIADIEVRDHLQECLDCSRELREFRKTIESIEDLGRDDVPDPGEQYWASFLPSVKSRMENAERVGLSRPLAAAAVVLLAVSLVLFSLIEGPEEQGELAEVTARLDRAFDDENLAAGDLLDAADTAELPLIELATVMPDESDMDPAILLEALDSLEPSGLAGWWSSEITLRLDALDEEEAARLKTSLAGEAS